MRRWTIRYALRSRVLKRLRRYGDALHALKDAELAAAPDEVPTGVFAESTDIYLQNGDIPQAFTVLDRGLAAHSEQAILRLRRAPALSLIGETERGGKNC